ncbi:MAG: DUF1752 domain-containing protein [Actinobacteria bacterium]|nr:DUF1752 domain-containing protein [Actinomycetota bacterium]
MYADGRRLANASWRNLAVLRS